MACGNSCPCHFKWQADIQGSKRDPVNSEKAWLDFAVRLLSREVVGKGKGQEAVWSERCKPQWWDKLVRLPWKNPTSNPKDTKEVLLKKYIALERHLHEEDRFPEELEEEAKLWSEGKYKELFLQTSLASLLTKVTGVHAAIIDAISKANELKAKVNQSVLSDLQQCLSSTLEITESLAANDACSNKAATKRSHPYCENSKVVPMKQRKSEQIILPSVVEKVSSSTSPNSFDQPKEISKIRQNSTATGKISSNTVRVVKKCERRIQPKILVAASNERLSSSQDELSQNFALQQVASKNNITLSLQELSHLFQGNLITHSHSSALNNVNAHAQETPTESSFNILDSISTAFIENKAQHNQFNITENSTPSNSNPENENTHVDYDSDASNYQSSHFIPESESTHIGYDSDLSNYPSSLSMSHNKWSPSHSEIDFLLSQTEDELSSDNIFSSTAESISSQTSFNTTPELITVSRNHSDKAGSLDSVGDSERGCYNVSGVGCTSGRDVVYSDGISASKEQHKLWEEDGSFLLHRFLDDIDNQQMAA